MQSFAPCLVAELVAAPAAGLVRVERSDDDRRAVGGGRPAVDEPLKTPVPGSTPPVKPKLFPPVPALSKSHMTLALENADTSSV